MNMSNHAGSSTLSLKLDNLSHNLCLYYSLLVDDIYERLMHKALAAGHQGLKLSHALILPQISSHGSRIVDIAKSQGVSKQAIGQIANELEHLGYITRTDDPEDKRSKKLILTPQGIALIRQAASFMNDVDSELEKQLGQDVFMQLKNRSCELFRNLALKYPDAGTYTPDLGKSVPLIVFATPLATHLDLLLQQQNASKGHTPLKRSYWQVLEKITQNGVRINDLAEWNGISKQAISQLANEIEKAGYIARVDDPTDKRAKNLVPTTQGEQLILDTLESTAHVENQVRKSIGDAATRELKQAFEQYLAYQKNHSAGTTPAEAQLQATLQKFITGLSEQEKALWLEAGTQRLGSHALAQISKMEFVP